MRPLVELLRPAQGIVQVDRVNRHIAQVSDPAQVVGRDPGCLVHQPHQGRLAANLPRAMTLAGAVGRAAVPRQTYERNVDLRGILNLWQTHERRSAGEPGKLATADRLEETAVAPNGPVVSRVSSLSPLSLTA